MSGYPNRFRCALKFIQEQYFRFKNAYGTREQEVTIDKVEALMSSKLKEFSAEFTQQQNGSLENLSKEIENLMVNIYQTVFFTENIYKSLRKINKIYYTNTQ